MKLIAGLGNPGKEYEQSRHNVGFLALKTLVTSDQRPVTSISERWDGELVKIGSLLLLKPMTFMNRSGLSIKKVMQFYKLKPEDLWLIHDDLDIELGKFKIQKGKGPKKHNGVLSVEQELGTTDFWRVRIGVENRHDKRIPGDKYVLMKFNEEELRIINKVIDEVVEKVCYYLRDEVSYC